MLINHLWFIGSEISDKLEVVKNKSKEQEAFDKGFTDEFQKTNNPIDSEAIIVDKKPEELNIILVEQVPIFPGCEDAFSNDERRQCMFEKMGKFI